MGKGKADKGGPAPKKTNLLAHKSGQTGGKAKKKKWSKGKVKEKLQNAVYFDEETYNKLLNDFPKKNKLITPSSISDKLHVNVSLARQAIKELEARGLIRRIGDHHHSQVIYTRFIQNEEA